MANAPALLNAYSTVARIFDDASLSPTERQIVLIATSRENGCEYCVAAHTVIAGMQSVAKAISDRKLEALRLFTIALVATRGRLSDAAVENFAAAGSSQQQLLEVVLGVGVKTISNYTNHIAHIPLDGAFSSAAWSRAA